MLYRSLQGGYAYIRFHNPTCEAVQKAVNSIEGGFGSVVFGSGMAAISTTLLTFLQPGDHAVSISFLHTYLGLRYPRNLLLEYSATTL